MNISILRPFFIYGPGQSSEKLIARLVTSVCDGKRITIAGKDGLIINPVFVDDVVALLLSILDTPGNRTLMLAGPDALSIRAIADLIGRQVGHDPIYEQTDGNGGRLIADHRTAENLLGRPMTRFTDGISRLL